MLQNPYETKKTALSQQELNAILRAHELYVSGRGGLRAQLAHKSLDGLILANRNLEEADFSGASLVGASLYGSKLHRAVLYCADLRGCDLRLAKLTRADLRGASFKGATLAHAVLDNADLRSGMMMYVGADEVTVVDRNAAADHPGQKSSANPNGVDFTNCSLKGVSFGNAKLDGANFTGALLQGATFKNANLTNVVFKDAVLTGVHLADLHVPPEALEGSVQDVAPAAAQKADQLKSKLEMHQRWLASEAREGSPAVLDQEDLRPIGKLFLGRRLSGLSARHALAIGLDFSQSQLQAAKFDHADLRGANFSGSDLRGASFKGAKLAHAIFDHADIRALGLANGARLSTDMTDAEMADEQLDAAVKA